MLLLEGKKNPIFKLPKIAAMAGRTLLYGGGTGASSVNPVLFQNQRFSCSSSEPHESIFISASSSSFLGPSSMVSFEDVKGGKRSERSFFHSFDQDENGDEELDEYFRQPEKKRRLTGEQVQFLERSFELENKLEPERKIELAKELGLQPRQVAIWFQNRRARWRTKQLEKDYDGLQSSYNNLKADYENLLKEKDNLKAEVARITDKLLLKEKDNGNLYYGSDISAASAKEPSADSVSEDEIAKASALDMKQEDLSSVKSDVFDSDSPRYNDGVHSSLLERDDSPYVFEPELDHSDLSQDEEDNITKNLLHPACGFQQIEEACYSDSPSSGYFVFPVEDQAFGFWS